MTETAVKPEAEQHGREETTAAIDPPSADDEPIDEELLEEAIRGFGMSTRNAAINAILREYVEKQRVRRLQAFDRLQQWAEEEDLDFSAIEEVD